MRIGQSLVGLSAVALSLVACGDDDDGPGGAGGGTTVATTTSVASTTAASTSTGMMGAPIGSSCATNEDCAGGLCLTEDYFGWAQGYCTALCEPELAPCEEGVCLNAGTASLCIQECDSVDDCPGVANQCVPFTDPEGAQIQICIGGCTEDAQCTSTMNCDIAQGEMFGVCIPPEICDQPGDEDGDGREGCEDTDCATDCAAEIMAACSGAATLALGANMGTTSGDSLFTGSCQAGGAPEDLFTYTAAQTGYLQLALTSTDDLGVSVRTTCADPLTEIGCADALFGGDTENLSVEIQSGATVTVLVDGYAAGRDGDYTLNASFAIPVPEIEPNDASNVANVATAGIVTGSVNPDTDQDWFVITLAAPATITASTISRGTSICGQGTLDSILTLFEFDGMTIIDENDDINPFFGDFCSIVSGATLPAGTYYLRVQLSPLAPMGTTFDYGLSISIQ
jgi:hypothetical protein